MLAIIRFLIRLAIYVGTAALVQSILTPFIVTMARKYAPAVLGGIGLVSTFVALLLASFFPGGITLSGIDTWVLASLIVWLITALGGWLLPLLFLRGKLADASTPATA